MNSLRVEHLEALVAKVNANSDMLTAINATLQEFNINTTKRIQYFITHVLVETANLQEFKENLNYSAAGLCEVWPSRFTLTGEADKANANDYEHNPEKLGSFVYAGRNGNGDEASGDGWKYLGRGGLGLTFKDNYTEFGAYCNLDLINYPQEVSETELGLRSAGWFWSKRNINAYADASDFASTVRIINGSSATLQARTEVLTRVSGVINDNSN